MGTVKATTLALSRTPRIGTPCRPGRPQQPVRASQSKLEGKFEQNQKAASSALRSREWELMISAIQLRTVTAKVAYA